MIGVWVWLAVAATSIIAVPVVAFSPAAYRKLRGNTKALSPFVNKVIELMARDPNGWVHDIDGWAYGGRMSKYLKEPMRVDAQIRLIRTGYYKDGGWKDLNSGIEMTERETRALDRAISVMAAAKVQTAYAERVDAQVKLLMEGEEPH